MPRQKRPFVVDVEAKLIVHAFDEESARKKVEKAFASGRALAVRCQRWRRSVDLRRRTQQDSPGT